MAPAASMRLLLAAFGDPGHVFPTIALGRALAERGHEVDGRDLGGAPRRRRGRRPRLHRRRGIPDVPSPDPDSEDGAHAAEAARALLPLLEGMRPHAVVSDILTLAPTLAAEKAGVPLATLIPHIYPVVEPGLPFFAIGLQPPRTPLGRGIWRAGQRALNVGLEHGRRDLNRQRAAARPAARSSASTAGSAPTWPWSRPSPARVPAALAGRGRGHRADDLRDPHPDIELPPGDEPLVLVAPSTAHDSEQPAGAHGAGGARRGAGAGRRDDQPRRAPEPDRGPRPTPSSSTGSATAS